MNIIGKRKIWYIISAILIVPGIIALFTWGLNFGIDFKGGTLIEVRFKENTSVDQVKKGLSELNLHNLTVVSTKDKDFLIRLGTIDNDTHNKITESLAKVGENSETRYESVGPTVSNDIERKAIISVIIASIAIILYIAFSFRRLPKPASSWRFGVSAVLALIHDLVFVVGTFSILSHYFNYEIDSLFITALLTIMGFSVHDTIVVFDRIRENLRKHPNLDLETNANNSIIQTINRSLNTSLTVLIVLTALYVLGGQTLKQFILVLIIGITIGTYSSIFNASPILVSWQGWSANRLAKKNAS